MKSIRQVPGFCFLGMVVFVMVPGGFRSVPDTRRNMFFAQQKRSRDFTPGEITILHDLECGEIPVVFRIQAWSPRCPNEGSRGGSESRLQEGGWPWPPNVRQGARDVGLAPPGEPQHLEVESVFAACSDP